MRKLVTTCLALTMFGCSRQVEEPTEKEPPAAETVIQEPTVIEKVAAVEKPAVDEYGPRVIAVTGKLNQAMSVMMTNHTRYLNGSITKDYSFQTNKKVFAKVEQAYGEFSKLPPPPSEMAAFHDAMTKLVKHNYVICQSLGSSDTDSMKFLQWLIDMNRANFMRWCRRKEN